MNASRSHESFRLDGDFTIHRASEIKDALLPLPDGSGPLQLNLGEVTEIDASGVQLLLLVAREADAVGRSFLLGNPSAPVLELLSLLGLQDQLTAVG